MRRKILKIQAASKDRDCMSEEKDCKLAAVIGSKQNVPRKIVNLRLLATMHIKKLTTDCES